MGWYPSYSSEEFGLRNPILGVYGYTNLVGTLSPEDLAPLRAA